MKNNSSPNNNTQFTTMKEAAPETHLSNSPKSFFNHRLTILSLVVLLFGLAIVTILVTQPQIFKQRAAAPICPIGGAICSWTVRENESYQYTITDITSDKVIASGNTQTGRVTFTPIVDHRYRCEVVPINDCGQGPSASTQNTCNGQEVTPTPVGQIITATPTPPLPTVTQPVITSTPTPTPNPTMTPSPTLTPAPSPTPLAENLPKGGVTQITLALVIFGLTLITAGVQLTL